MRVSEKVSSKTPRARLTPMIEKPIESDFEVFLDGIEDCSNGQEGDRKFRRRRRDCRAFHIDGKTTRPRRQVTLLRRRENDPIHRHDGAKMASIARSTDHAHGGIPQD